MPDEAVPTAAVDPTVPEGSQFTIAGRVDGWEPHTRQLTIGDRPLWVAATVLVVGLTVGAPIVASGYQDPLLVPIRVRVRAA